MDGYVRPLLDQATGFVSSCRENWGSVFYVAVFDFVLRVFWHPRLRQVLSQMLGRI